jgi:hypothetical protein
MSTRSA